MNESAIRSKLLQIGQDRLVCQLDRLDDAERRRLLAQLAALDLDLMGQLIESHVKTKPRMDLPHDIRPAEAYPRTPDNTRRALYDQASQRGQQLLRDGKVAAFLVAGGQGSRLGYEGPKGEYPVTPIRRKPLFQVFAEQLRAFGRDYGRPIPWYIMTSDANDAQTRAFFQRNGHFGYDPADIFIFQQGMMPAFSFDGHLLLSEPDSLALSPDGHGGSLRALDRSGALADMRRRGVEHLSYFQVDNPLVHCMDELFLGLHDLTGSEMSSKTIAKAGPLEKVGNFVVADGKLQVIEYSDLPEKLAMQTNPDGSLRFNAGSIAIHALSVSFIERLNRGGKLQLPWHRAEKKVPCIDEAGNRLSPDKPNGVKLEQFVFDAIPLAQKPIVYTTDRAEEFSPVKNAEGSDSPATCRRDQIRRHARWLADAGVTVPMKDGEPDAVIEISPLYATSSRQIRERSLPFKAIERGQSVYLE